MPWITKQLRVIAVVAIVVSITSLSPATTNDDCHKQDYTLDAIALSAAITGTILSDSVPGAGMLQDEGCAVWQQPGVALAITSVWKDGRPVKLYFNPDKLHSFLAALPNYICEEPFLHPSEPEGGNEFYIEPQVYLLDADQSRSRLREYMVGYEMWMGFNESMDFLQPDEQALLTDFAVVYIDSGGPLEFHFRLEDGELKLQHLFLWDFFSA